LLNQQKLAQTSNSFLDGISITILKVVKATKAGILWSQVKVLVGPPEKQTLIRNGGGFCLLSVTLSNACGASQLTHITAMIYYRKTLFGCGPKLTAVHYRANLNY